MAEKILIISPVPVFPSYAGNRQRILGICSELMKTGKTLDFFYTGFDKTLDKKHQEFFNGRVLSYNADSFRPGRHTVFRVAEIINGCLIRLDRLKRRFADDKNSARYNRSPSEYRHVRKRALLREQIKGVFYDAVIVNYAPYVTYFSLFSSNTRKILDTHDVLTDRYKMYLRQNEKPVRWYSLRYREEKKMIRKADVVWAITSREKQHFESMKKGQKPNIRTLTHLTPYRNIAGAETTQSNDILMVGSGNRINIEGLSWFLDSVWQEIHRSFPAARLVVAGSICDKKERITGKNRKGVWFYGRYETSGEVYGLSEICINPMRYGTGLKIKTLEALSHGKVILTTRTGASGLENFTGKGLICSDDPEVWISELTAWMNRTGGAEPYKKQIKEEVEKMYKQNLEILEKSLG